MIMRAHVDIQLRTANEIDAISLPPNPRNRKRLRGKSFFFNFSLKTLGSPKMDSDDEAAFDDFDDFDSGNESSGDDVGFSMDEEAINPARERQEADEYSYEVLTTEQILLHMNECMREVYLESPPREVDVKCIQSLEIMKDNDLFFPFDCETNHESKFYLF